MFVIDQTARVAQPKTTLPAVHDLVAEIRSQLVNKRRSKARLGMVLFGGRTPETPLSGLPTVVANYSADTNNDHGWQHYLKRGRSNEAGGTTSTSVALAKVMSMQHDPSTGFRYVTAVPSVVVLITPGRWGEDPAPEATKAYLQQLTAQGNRVVVLGMHDGGKVGRAAAGLRTEDIPQAYNTSDLPKRYNASSAVRDIVWADNATSLAVGGCGVQGTPSAPCSQLRSLAAAVVGILQDTLVCPRAGYVRPHTNAATRDMYVALMQNHSSYRYVANGDCLDPYDTSAVNRSMPHQVCVGPHPAAKSIGSCRVACSSQPLCTHFAMTAQRAGIPGYMECRIYGHLINQSTPYPGNTAIGWAFQPGRVATNIPAANRGAANAGALPTFYEMSCYRRTSVPIGRSREVGEDAPEFAKVQGKKNCVCGSELATLVEGQYTTPDACATLCASTVSCSSFAMSQFDRSFGSFTAGEFQATGMECRLFNKACLAVPTCNSMLDEHALHPEGKNVAQQVLSYNMLSRAPAVRPAVTTPPSQGGVPEYDRVGVGGCADAGGKYPASYSLKARGPAGTGGGAPRLWCGLTCTGYPLCVAFAYASTTGACVLYGAGLTNEAMTKRNQFSTFDGGSGGSDAIVSTTNTVPNNSSGLSYTCYRRRNRGTTSATTAMAGTTTLTTARITPTTKDAAPPGRSPLRPLEPCPAPCRVPEYGWVGSGGCADADGKYPASYSRLGPTGNPFPWCRTRCNNYSSACVAYAYASTIGACIMYGEGFTKEAMPFVLDPENGGSLLHYDRGSGGSDVIASTSSTVPRNLSQGSGVGYTCYRNSRITFTTTAVADTTTLTTARIIPAKGAGVHPTANTTAQNTTSTTQQANVVPSAFDPKWIIFAGGVGASILGILAAAVMMARGQSAAKRRKQGSTRYVSMDNARPTNPSAPPSNLNAHWSPGIATPPPRGVRSSHSHPHPNLVSNPAFNSSEALLLNDAAMLMLSTAEGGPIPTSEEASLLDDATALLLASARAPNVTPGIATLPPYQRQPASRTSSYPRPTPAAMHMDARQCPPQQHLHPYPYHHQHQHQRHHVEQHHQKFQLLLPDVDVDLAAADQADCLSGGGGDSRSRQRRDRCGHLGVLHSAVLLVAQHGCVEWFAGRQCLRTNCLCNLLPATPCKQ